MTVGWKINNYVRLVGGSRGLEKKREKNWIMEEIEMGCGRVGR